MLAVTDYINKTRVQIQRYRAAILKQMIPKSRL